MSAPLDLELKKAFTELQAKVIDTQQKVKLADLQIEQLNRTKKHAHLTDTEIMTLSDQTRMYEGVGRIIDILDIGEGLKREYSEHCRRKKEATSKEYNQIVKEEKRLQQQRLKFILQSKGVIHTQLKDKQKVADEKIKELEQKKSYLERSVKNSEDNIREMLMARRAQ